MSKRINRATIQTDAHEKGRTATNRASLIRQIPVPIYVPGSLQQAHQRQYSQQQASWKKIWSSWFRYYSIQFRWDIERRVARLFHRRWGQ